MIEKSIFLITSKDPENNNFGTGFVIQKSSDATYVLTCSHVIRDVGGIDKVEIDTYSVTVVAQSADGHAEDLAVLRIETVLVNPILPLGNFGKSGSNFTICGYWLFDKRSKQYRLEPIQGFLGKSVKQKSRYQTEFINAWQLKINDDSMLRPGFSGSPVIDSRTFTVIGVVTHLEGQGSLGQAVSIINLNNFWVEIPHDLFREKPYDLEVIRNLVKSIIINQTQLLSFIKKYFSDVSIPDFSLVGIDFLVNYCHRENKVGELLNNLNNIAPKKYRELIFKINQYPEDGLSTHHKSSNLCNHFYFYKIIKRRYKNFNSEDISQCEIELAFENLSKFTPEVQQAAIGALAGVLGIPREKIKVLEVRKGSVKIRIRIPSTSLDKLIELYETDRLLMHSLGIVDVIELLEERFNLNNIRKLLHRGFSREELVTICLENFGFVYELITSNNTQLEIVDKLIEYTYRELQIFNLLEIARQAKPDIYDKFSPYYKFPRRPARTTGSRQSRRANSYRLSWGEIFRVGLLGTCVSALGFLLIIIIICFISEFVGLLLLFIGLPLLGYFVGTLVSIETRNVGGEVVGRIAFISYFVGFMLAMTLILNLTNLSDITMQENIVEKLISTLVKFTIHISLSGTGGGFVAYQRAKLA